MNICSMVVLKWKPNQNIIPATDLIAIHNSSLVVSAEEPHLDIRLQLVVSHHLTKPRDYRTFFYEY
jgi:hypothetical protein